MRELNEHSIQGKEVKRLVEKAITPENLRSLVKEV
jgi:hypothetical protein